LFTFIEGWYNPRRQHSGLDDRFSAYFEKTHIDTEITYANTDAFGSTAAPFASGLIGAGGALDHPVQPKIVLEAQVPTSL
jgi:hypothetical protein